MFDCDRLPPLVNPETATRVLTEALTSNPPYQSVVTYTSHGASSGWAAPLLVPWLDSALSKASTVCDARV